MLGFLNPWLLWVLPSAAAPILIHLIFLMLARRVSFSDLTFLRAAYLRAVSACSDRIEGLPSTRLEWSLDRATAVTALRHLEAGHRTTDFIPPLQAAYEFLRTSRAKRRVIVILSDNAAHGWRSGESERSMY